MTRDGVKLIKFAYENDTLSCVWLIPGFRSINLPHSGISVGAFGYLFSIGQINKFSFLIFQGGY